MRRSIRAGLSVLALGGGLAAFFAYGGPLSAAPPVPPPAAPAPKADAPAPRVVAVVPPGYEKVTVAGHTALAEPNDVAWVKQALTDTKPPAKNGVTPADMIQTLVDKRAALTKQMVTDLALPDDKAVNEFLDTKVISTLKKLDELRPPIFYLVITQDKLRDLTKTGWGEPRYHYNGVANAAAVDDSLPYSIDKPMDDTILPAFYNDKDAADVRAKNLAAGLQNFDANLAANGARQANPAVFNLFVGFIQEKQIDPLKLKRDQSWLGSGVANFLAAKYTAVVTGVDKNRMLQELTSEPNLFPVSARSVDLAHPLDEASMKASVVPYYTVSMQRKATAVVAVWVDQAGEAAIPRTLTALRAKMPADGAALVKVIQDVTGADLSKYLAAN
ncbi:MAG: hypothetical protein JWN40_4758 [Phycisphaerales bacterium]|nr:hypothetical protein [Phycisphaerales bacterium]